MDEQRDLLGLTVGPSHSICKEWRAAQSAGCQVEFRNHNHKTPRGRSPHTLRDTIKCLLSVMFNCVAISYQPSAKGSCQLSVVVGRALPDMSRVVDVPSGKDRPT